MWIPNLLSILRMLIAVIFPFVAPEHRIYYVTAALLTEYFDGYTARHFGWITPLGRILDPVADKMFALSVGLTLVIAEKISLLQLGMVAFRDIAVFIVFLIYLAIRKQVRIQQKLSDFEPHLLGKLTTALQYAVFITALLWPGLLALLVYGTGGVSIVAGAIYIFKSASIAAWSDRKFQG